MSTYVKKWLLPKKGTKALLMPEDHPHPISKSVIKSSSKPSTLGLPDLQRNSPRRISVPTPSSPKSALYHLQSVSPTLCVLSTLSSTSHSSNQQHRTQYQICHNLHPLPLKSTANPSSRSLRSSIQSSTDVDANAHSSTSLDGLVTRVLTKKHLG